MLEWSMSSQECGFTENYLTYKEVYLWKKDVIFGNCLFLYLSVVSRTKLLRPPASS